MSASETAEILRKAKALIDAPEKWTKDAFIHDGCMCSMGALLAAKGLPLDSFGAQSLMRFPEYRALDNAAMDMGCYSVVHLNDREPTTHADVMALFDRAIELASKQEA